MRVLGPSPESLESVTARFDAIIGAADQDSSENAFDPLLLESEDPNITDPFGRLDAINAVGGSVAEKLEEAARLRFGGVKVLGRQAVGFAFAYEGRIGLTATRDGHARHGSKTNDETLTASVENGKIRLVRERRVELNRKRQRTRLRDWWVLRKAVSRLAEVNTQLAEEHSISLD